MATEKALRAAAKELNEVLGLDPAMNVKAPVADLTAKVTEAIELITEEDTFSEATQAVIDEIKNADEDPEPEEEKKPARKPAAPAPAEKKAPSQAFQKKDYSRNHAFVDALKKGGTKDEIIAMTDEFYADHGGKANPKGAKATFDIYMPLLKLLGTVKEKNGKYGL